MKVFRFIFSVTFCLIAGSAAAQQMDEPPTMMMQPREPAPIIDGNAPPQMANPAQVEVTVSSLEDEIRQLRGQIEEDQNQIHKLSDSLDKLQRDTDFRFGELSHPAAAATAAPAPIKPKTAAATPASPPAPTGPTTAGDGVLHPPESPDTAPTTPRELYNYAFRLLNQTKYDEAAAAFDSFTKQYPKDPLVGNAYYWEGETYYIRRDYVTAADDFRQGFEALPNGPKAADNLLKLAMSLDAQSRDKEACVVLQQIVTKFKKSSIGVIDKAQAEIKRIACQ